MTPQTNASGASTTEVILLRPRQGINESRSSYPLGLVQLRSAFSASFPISIFDADGLSREGKSFARIKKELIGRAETKASVLIVGITTNDANLPEALHLARLLKKTRRDCHVVFGGPGVYFDSQKLIDSFPDLIDVIVRGEGSLVFPGVVASIVAGDRELLTKKIVSAPKVENMDSLPFPRYDLLRAQQSLADDPEDAWLPIFAGAGCAHTCKYCSTSNFWGHRVGYKSRDRLIREIEALGKLGHRNVEFIHDNLFSDMSVVVGLAERLIEDEIDVRWGCSGRIDDFDLSALPTLMRSGCRKIFWGMESGSAQALEIMGKKIDLVESKKKLFRILSEKDLHSTVSFVYNHPGDSCRMFEETLGLAVEIKSRFPYNSTLSLNNYLNLSGTAFGRGVFARSPFLIGKIDFDQELVEKNPERFPFFSTSKDVTGLSTEFRFQKLNYIIDSYPKTIHCLAAALGLGLVSRALDRATDVRSGLQSLIAKLAPGSIGRDLLAFEAASHVGAVRRRGKPRLLATRIDVNCYPDVREEKRCYYLFSASAGAVDTYEITEEYHRQFKNFSRHKQYDKHIVSEILRGLEATEDRE